ncbi:unnamed protein product [Cuscuta epithymum]|uniref:Integrase catalytic domain-containing protein n=1 Tax=Cuscuta epithymum TaxID=186058 RepID=A0AAV0FCT8_9ASTE|nr:unnamed protein product [Cuscuta epithymum]
MYPPMDTLRPTHRVKQDLRNRLSRPAVVPVEVLDVHGAILGMTKMLGTLAKDVRRAIPSTHQKPPQPHGTQVPTNHPAVEVEVTSPAPSRKNGEKREGRGIPVSSNQPARSEASVFSRLGDRRRSAKDRLGRSHHVEKERDTQNHRGRHDHGEEEHVQTPKVTHMTASHHSLGHMTEHVGGTEIRSQKPRNTEVEDGGRKRVTIQADRTKNDLNDVEVRKLWRKIEDLQRQVDAGDGNTDATLKTVTPFTTRIMAYPLPIGFKAPHVKAYSGTSDPQEHLSRYYANMIMIGASEEIICRCFLATLEGTACEWFNSLPHGSIDEWEDLAQRFLQHFAASKRTKQHYSHLLTVKQKKGEDLKDFVIRWRKESSAVHGADDQTRFAMFQAALRAGEFASSLIRDPPRSYQAALQRADRYADAEIREVQKKKDESSEPWREGSVPHHKKQKKNKKDFNYGPRQILNTSSMPLTHPVGTILDYAERMGLMQGPRPEGEVYTVFGAKKYCRYHRVDNHDTEECFTLKREIERLIQRGHLSNFVKGAAQQPNHVWRKSSEQVACTQPETRRVEKRHIGNESDEDASDEPGPKRDKRNHDINFIYGGNAGGDSLSLRKKWARQLYIGEIMHSPMKKKVRREPICFTDDDLPPCPSPHRDAMVIKMEINDLVIHRTLVDTGSSVNIMYLDTFEKLKLSKGKLHPIKTPLSGFTGDSIEAEGVVTVPVEVGDTSHKVKLNMEFVVVRLTCAHNLILGRPGLEDLQCIVSPAHLCIKFPTPTGVGIARGSQKLARTCYIKITKKVGRHGLQVNTVATQYLQDEERRPRAEPSEGTEDVTLDPATPERKVKIGTGLSAELRAEVITVLTMYQGIFARGPEDMPGISRDVISHRLDVNTMSNPVKQKKRYMSSDRREFVRKEVGTLLKIGHIKEVKYPEWLANVVLAPKPPTWRMCVDYTDLNKACPMDPFLLPNIDQLVDETAGCELMSFIDAFSGYHQIRMHEEDAEKTSFMTPEGVFCYLVMAFGLKNSGATYTRMISKLFRPVLGRTMEAYVDDMIVKSKRAGTHAVDLAEVFKIMEKFNLRLKIRCDSKLVVGQITTEFEAKEERMRLYRDAALELLKLFIAYEIEQIPRAQNVEADMLSKLSAETPERISKIARIEELDTSSIYACPVQAITTRDADWIDSLIKYINEGVLPAEEVEAKVTKMRAPSYTILNEKLYKRSYNGTLLKCLRPDEAKVAMEEIHAGICSAHQGAHTMSRKVILQGFFWPTIVKDCAEFVKRCVVCQEFQKSPGRPATNYTPISTAIPFARWGIDLIGALPRGTGSVRWVIVAIDYFTKWIEAVPLASITEGQCRKFVMKHILCRFGVPQQIITDNGRQFGASGFNEFCESWGIKHSNASVAYPQANGQVENANRTIMDGLKKKLETAGGEWAEELPQILWAYRTTPRKATGETPFALTYGFEARAPAEVILHSRREEEYDPETNEEVMATELLFIEERREAAFCRAENYRRQVKGYHDSRVRKRNFEVGDYVLRKREVSKPLEGGKFAKNYEGPYVIKSVIRPGTFKLQTPKGKEIERTWNAEHLLKFYH